MFPSKILPQLTNCNWLSGLALWAVIGAWGSCGVWGWLQIQSGLFAAVVIALTIGAAVFAARSLANAVKADGALRKCALVALGAACVVQTAYSGHQALMVSEAQRWGAYERYEATAKANAAIDARIAALPAIPLSDEAGRPIGPARTRELGAQRSNEVARLAGLKTPVSVVAAPATRMSDALAWAVAALVEGLGLLGFFAIGAKPAIPAAKVASSAASELARRRWNLA